MLLRALICLFFAASLGSSSAFAQTRINPPFLTHYQTDSINQSPATRIQTQEIDAQIPIPQKLFFAMPYLDLSGWHMSTREQEGSSTPDSFQQGRLGIGLLHHADEGAPAWKIGISYGAGSAKINDQAQSSSRQNRYGDLRLDLNLEKWIPSLRPQLTDRVFAWIGFKVVSSLDRDMGPLMLPELGWEFSRERFSLRLVVPKEARVRWVLVEPYLSTSLEVGEKTRVLTYCSENRLKDCLDFKQFAYATLDWRFYKHLELSFFGGFMRDRGAQSKQSLVGVRIVWDPYWSYTP